MLKKGLKILFLLFLSTFSFETFANQVNLSDSVSFVQEVSVTTAEESKLASDSVVMSVVVDTVFTNDKLVGEDSDNRLTLSRRDKRKARLSEPFLPNPRKATWYAIVCPGLGQIYNRSYWKLPIVYGGVLTFAYFIGWNGRMYNDYRNAYFDITDSDPNTNSFLDLVPKYNPEEKDKFTKQFKTKTTGYRRGRDLCIFGSVALYVVSVIDAFVDAHLYDFEVSEDLSFRIEPVLENYSITSYRPSVGVQCCLKFK